MASARSLLQNGGSWVGRVMRILLATFALLVVFALVAARITYARATDAGLDFGEELRQMGERNLAGEHKDDLYGVMLNGQLVDSTSASSRRSMHELLDYFQTECKEDAVGMADKFADLPRSVGQLATGKSSEGFLTVRREQDNRGFVLCFGSERSPSRSERLAQVRKAGTTGELGALGDVRYVVVYKAESGSRVFAAWTHGSFNVYKMFPDKGDVPGEDLAGIPRPDGGRRILSATVTGAPFGVNAYEVMGADAAAVAKELNTKLLSRGWKLVPTAPGVPNDTQFYTLGNSVDVGINARKVHGDRTQVSYLVSLGMGKVTR
jgi:hypothetical protein